MSSRVRLLAWLQPIVLALVAISSIVTPLGLYDKISPNDEAKTLFAYAPDVSAFGRATHERSEYKSLRVCYEFGTGPTSCPGAPLVDNEKENTTENYRVWPSSVELFTSGEVAPTVANIFDIEWRSYLIAKRWNSFLTDLPSMKGFAQGFYTHLTNLITHETVEAVEGLLVDTKIGRIGFRNHTAPVDVGLGVEWTEDILFFEPETRCVKHKYYSRIQT